MALANQLKTFFPWLCIVALAAGLFVQRSRSKDQETELAALRQANQELKGTRIDSEDLKKIQAQVEELGRLRKENEELHRLRNEVRQLREEKQVAARTSPSGQAPAPPAKADAATVRQLEQQLRQMLAENERLRAESQQLQFQQLQVSSQANACVNNLRTLEGAKQQWALENKKIAGTPVGAEDIQPYLRNNAIPVCPLGGTYALNTVGTPPTCSMPGHVLPQ